MYACMIHDEGMVGKAQVRYRKNMCGRMGMNVYMCSLLDLHIHTYKHLGIPLCKKLQDGLASSTAANLH